MLSKEQNHTNFLVETLLLSLLQGGRGFQVTSAPGAGMCMDPQGTEGSLSDGLPSEQGASRVGMPAAHPGQLSGPAARGSHSQFGLVQAPVAVISEEDDGAIFPWQGTADLLRDTLPVLQAAGVVGLHFQSSLDQHIVAGTLEEDDAVQRREEEGCVGMSGQASRPAQL